MPHSRHQPPSAETLGAVRRFYEADVLSVRDLAKRFDLSPSTIYAVAKRETWTRRGTRAGGGGKLASAGGFLCPGLAACPERTGLVARLWAGLEKEVQEAAEGLAEFAPGAAARNLAVLTRTLEKLVDMDREALGARAPAASATNGSDDAPHDATDPATAADLDRFRLDLARRMDALVARGEAAVSRAPVAG